MNVTNDRRDDEDEARLHELLGSYADGNLEERGRAELAGLLSSSESARRTYLRYVHLAAMLEEQCETIEVARTAGRPPPQPPRSRIVVKTAALAAVAIVLCFILALLAPTLRETHSRSGVHNSPSEPTPAPHSTPVQHTGREEFVCLAIEISGSMAAEGREFGPVLERSLALLEDLPAGHYFNVVAFASTRKIFRPAPVAATPANLIAARTWLESLRPDRPGRPTWPSDEWRTYRNGDHFGADIYATMDFCFDLAPERLIYATDWVMDPGSARVTKQRLIESLRRWQGQRESPWQLDVIVDRLDGHNRFLGAVAQENGGRFIEARPGTWAAGASGEGFLSDRPRLAP